MIKVIDIAWPQGNLDLSIPWNDGWRTVYVKLGGDNNPRYESEHYDRQVDAARAIGYRVGHYWVPEDSQDPVGSARWFVQNLRNWDGASDFIVLDNESFPDNDPDGSGPQTRSDRYSDDQAAAWVNEVKLLLGIPGNQIEVYYGLADARATDHTNVLSTGANFIIAAYSYEPFTFAAPSNIPMERIAGHQYGGIVFGGIATDVNMFRDDAFSYSANTNNNLRKEMRLVWSGNSGYLVTEDGFVGVPNVATYGLFYRLINSNQSNSPFVNGKTPEAFTADELKIMEDLIARLHPPVQVTLTDEQVALLASKLDIPTAFAVTGRAVAQ